MKFIPVLSTDFITPADIGEFYLLGESLLFHNRDKIIVNNDTYYYNTSVGFVTTIIAYLFYKNHYDNALDIKVDEVIDFSMNSWDDIIHEMFKSSAISVRNDAGIFQTALPETRKKVLTYIREFTPIHRGKYIRDVVKVDKTKWRFK